MADSSLALRWTYVAQTTAEYSEQIRSQLAEMEYMFDSQESFFEREDGSRHRDKDFRMLRMVDMLGLLDDN